MIGTTDRSHRNKRGQWHTLGFIPALIICAAHPVFGQDMTPQAAPPVTQQDIFGPETQDPYLLARRAFVWGYPLVRAAQLRQNLTLAGIRDRSQPPPPLSAPINRLGHARALATPEMRQGVAPNNDTLYSLAWLDMKDGPFVLEAPDFGQRYYTFQMGQADSATHIAFGQRTHGGLLPPIFIQGPDRLLTVPAGMLEVRSDQRYLMIAGRTLVEGDADLPNVHVLQDGMRLRLWSDYQQGRNALPPARRQRALTKSRSGVPDPLAFLEMLGNVLRDWRVAPEDQDLVKSFSQLGLTPQHGFRRAQLSAAVQKAMARGLRDGEAAVRSETNTLGTRVNGWAINYSGPQFQGNHLLRAAVAMDQIYVLPVEEALYPNARTDGTCRPLDGAKTYVLRFERDQLPPVDAFWSVTMYFAKGLLVPNSAKRYSIGDRTPGLVRGADGSIEIVMQHHRPRENGTNWLPTPSEPFMAMLRLYRPKAAALDRGWLPPAITEVAAR